MKLIRINVSAMQKTLPPRGIENLDMTQIYTNEMSLYVEFDEQTFVRKLHRGMDERKVAEVLAGLVHDLTDQA